MLNKSVLCFLFVLGIASYALGEFGEIHILNDKLKLGANEALRNINKLYKPEIFKLVKNPDLLNFKVNEQGEYEPIGQEVEKLTNEQKKQLTKAVHLKSVNIRMLQAIIGEERNGRAFNPGIALARPGYLFSIRSQFHVADNFVDGKLRPLPLKPGNSKISQYEVGTNFWWNDWDAKFHTGGTLFYYADANLEKFTLLFPTNMTDAFNVITHTDTRAVEAKKLYSWTPTSPTLTAEIKITNKEFPLGSLEFADKLQNPARGKNFAPLEIDIPEKQISYLDWFYPEGIRVRFISFLQKHNQFGTVDKFLKYKNNDYPILGTGSSSIEDKKTAKKNAGIMPLFSFGGTHIPFDDFKFFGVGHTKILVDEKKYPYVTPSNINYFRKNLVEDFKRAYGDRYIRHSPTYDGIADNQGYHYLMYFYVVHFKDGELVSMKISDSFLPIDLKAARDKNNYVFSLVFPMGVTDKANNENILLISAGIGDYYSVVIEIPFDFALDACTHDVTNLDMEKYQYKLMRFDGEGNFDVADRLFK